MHYQPLTPQQITPTLFAHFTRRQPVANWWCQNDGDWRIRHDPYTDDWSAEDYAIITEKLKAIAAAGGLVLAALNVAGELKGFATVNSAPMGANSEYLVLDYLHVSEELRGQGVGKALFEQARAWAGARGAQKLYISAHPSVETQAFYRAMGCVDALTPDAAHVAREPWDRQLECDANPER